MIKYGLLTAEDTMASEYEVYDFLYALVRILKPNVILETGCYKGGATRAMGRAVAENGIGHVQTCDTNPDYFIDPPVIEISSFTMPGIELIGKTMDVDFAFIDSSGDRVAEVAALNLAPGGVVVLHDSKRPQYKPIWTLRPWKAIWDIDTIQGITVFQS